VLNIGGKCRSQDVPQQGDTAPQQGVSVPQQNNGVKDEPFAFEMIPSAPLSASKIRPSSVPPTPMNHLSSIMEKLESLADAVAGIKAQMLCCFDSFEVKIAALEHATVSTPLPVRESCLPPLPSSIPDTPMAGFATELPPETTTPLAELPMYHWQGTTESSAFESPTIPLQLHDASNSYFNVSSAGGPANYLLQLDSACGTR